MRQLMLAELLVLLLVAELQIAIIMAISNQTAKVMLCQELVVLVELLAKQDLIVIQTMLELIDVYQKLNLKVAGVAELVQLQEQVQALVLQLLSLIAQALALL